jgi:rubrerythrin
VRGFVRRDPVQALRIPNAESIRRQVALMELETARFYDKSAANATDAEMRQLLGDLAAEERKHEDTSMTFDPDHQPASERAEEARTARQLFVLQVVQPGLAGLMDGSVSTLAPLFASAFATHNSWDAFRVGIAASVGAGISMGFAEALSDDGSLTGRGKPLLRGIVCGAMTFVGGIFHALPFLIENFMLATAIASCVVAVELFVIAWIRNRYMDTPFLQAAFQVVVGGVLVFLSGILIGSS